MNAYNIRSFQTLVHTFFLLACVILMIPVSVSAQGQFNFTAITTNDGLSSNVINDILRDRRGLMWFATEDGLNKFDGTKFSVYRHHPDDPKSIGANEVLCLTEDKAGNLWVGTSGGSLCRYDVRQDNFTTYSSDKTINKIRNNVILSVICDAEGMVWMGSYMGLSILNPATGVISDFLMDDKTPLSKAILCLFQDSKNRVWIGTPEGLYMYDGGTKRTVLYLHHPENKSSISSNTVRSITEDKQGGIWFGTRHGVSLKEASGDGFINFTHQPDIRSISKGQINSVDIDNQNRIWVGTESGLDILTSTTNEIVNIAFDSRNVQGITARDILSVYYDDRGIYWIGTNGGGINKYDQNLSLFNLVQSNPFDPLALPAPVVTSFTETADGKIYVGTEHGGVSLFNTQTRTFKRFLLPPSINNSAGGFVVRALLEISPGELAVGTISEGLIYLNTNTGQFRQQLFNGGNKTSGINDIYSLKKDRKGQLWIGTNGGGIIVMNEQKEIVARYVRKPEFPSDIRFPINCYIRDIVEDHVGNIWIATHGGGIVKLNPSTQEFSNFTQLNSQLPADIVQTILEDKQGNIWAGTLGGGLGLFDHKTNTFRTYSEKDGLLNNTIYKIAEDEKGRLWMSTNQGITSFDFESKKFCNFTHHNGIQQNNFVRGAGLRSSDGVLYFGGLNGFNYFKPEQLNKNRHAPKIIFTDLKISNQSVVPSATGPLTENILIADNINLSYKQNFALSFVGLNFTVPQKNQYSYKLEGFDKDWNQNGTANTAFYTNVDPGEYTFRVKASNNDGVWTEKESTIRIIVHPPFWMTKSAYFVYALLVLGLLFYSRYKGIQRMKRKFQLSQEKMQAEAQAREAERIRELDRQKIKFLTNLSHEFRTPLSLILGPIDALIVREDKEQSFKQLHMVKRNAKRLLSLVNQLLDFRKMEDQELRLHPVHGELVSFLREVNDSFQDLAERKKINLVFNNRIDRLYTYFDHDKMERILFNLMSNAFKFTPEGGKISLELDVIDEKSDADKTWVSIRVSDTGIGIPEDQQQKIFEVFYQHTTASSILNQGTGIGLSIAKEFVDMQGGRIFATNQPGGGAVFVVELPFAVVHPAADKENSTAIMPEADADRPALATGIDTKHADEEEPSVLLVEDNDDYRSYLKDGLKSYYKVYEAANGKEGWQRALAQHPQLIVSDISMPYMDGIELCKKIKSDKRTNHIPVILLTALTGESELLKGLETGANDYITKPFNFDVLNAKVRNLLTLNNCLKHTYTKQIKVIAPEMEYASADEKLMNDITEYLEENLTDVNLSVETLSRHLGLSRTTLYTKLRELTGQTPVEYIRTVKLTKACQLLVHTHLNIAQVAYSVGFATPNYFAKSFKSIYNMLPSEYAAKMRNKNK